MNEPHPLQSVIYSIIERYLARYEFASVGIYRFHAINGGEFSKYLNSLKITLNRKAFIPTYCWHYDPYGEHYILFLFICGRYGRYDLADLLPIIQRLWTSHSIYPVEQMDSIHITVNNSTDGMRHLDQWIMNLTEPQFCNKRMPHQRSYGVSQMI
jgi:hypothetical protein